MNAHRRSVILALFLLLAACAAPPAENSGEASRAPSSSSLPTPTPGPSPSGTPTASPTAEAVEVDSLVETVVDRLSVRRKPALSASRIGVAPVGLRAWVVDGPVEADGHEWFLLTGAPDKTDLKACNEGSELSCSTWIGWAAAGSPSGDAWLRPSAVTCPEARDLAAYQSLTTDEQLLCAGNEEWRLTVYVPPLVGGRGCFPVWVTDPEWMTSACTFTFPQPVERELDEDTSLQMFTPPELNTCGQPGVCWWDENKGQWVVVTGHLDDPVARSCRPVLTTTFEGEDVGQPPNRNLVIHECRRQFVVSSVDVADAGQ